MIDGILTLAIFLGVTTAFLLVGSLIADCILPRIGFVQRFLESLPLYNAED